MTDIAPIQDIVAELRAGRMVVLVDEEDRERYNNKIPLSMTANPIPCGIW